MSTRRQVVLKQSSGELTTLSFIETRRSLTIECGSITSEQRRPLASLFLSTKPRYSFDEIPIHNVVAATLNESTVEVSYLIRKGKKKQFCLMQLRGELAEKETLSMATEWCSLITRAAYQGSKPSKSLKVILNPRSGPGKARQIFVEKVEPIFRAAGCTLDTTYTTQAGHAIEIAQNMDLTYDALVIVSGDGVIHEVMNGLAKHATPEEAFSIPIAPIPAGSGNGLSLNILGYDDGMDPSAAALNVLKGRPLKIDLFSFTQGDQTRISFMSQCVGLIADLDIETVHLRWMGDLRFIWGYIYGVLARKTCRVELSMKVVEEDKTRMVDILHTCRTNAMKGKQVELPVSEGNWITFDKPIIHMSAGKGPFAARSLMQFPVSHPDDGLIDISIQEVVSRKFLFDALERGETGRSYWFDSNRYFKASAYRAKPLAGSGVVAVDGEAFPMKEFQVEVLPRMGTLLSPQPCYAPDFEVIDSKGTVRETARLVDRRVGVHLT